MKFWHVGLTVNDLNSAISQYEKLGLHVKDKFYKDELRANAALMIGNDGTGVELWQWDDKNHPQAKFIKYHLAFLSDNPKDDVKELEKIGCKVVIAETVGMLVTYTFLEDPSGIYIEIAKAKDGYGN